MNKEKALDILRTHNEWRRGAEIPMQDPKELGEAIDIAISVLEQEKKHAPKNTKKIKSNLPIDEAIYEEGFNSGVKSAALTWEDVRTILDKENDILHECNDNAQQVIEVYPKEEDYYGEILKRFNEQRKK